MGRGIGKGLEDKWEGLETRMRLEVVAGLKLSPSVVLT